LLNGDERLNPQGAASESVLPLQVGQWLTEVKQMRLTQDEEIERICRGSAVQSEDHMQALPSLLTHPPQNSPRSASPTAYLSREETSMGTGCCLTQKDDMSVWSGEVTTGSGGAGFISAGCGEGSVATPDTEAITPCQEEETRPVQIGKSARLANSLAALAQKRAEARLRRIAQEGIFVERG
jgi:hypothetical protein